MKASTGGGIAVGGFCARIAGEVIGRGLPLSEYERLWRKEFGKELEMHLRIRNFLNKMDDKDLDEFFALAKEENIEELVEKYGDMDRPMELVKKMLRRPRLMLKLASFGIF